MKYPQEFIAKAKALFPTWQSLHDALDSQSPFVGRYLDDNRYLDISAKDILEAKTLDELKERALKSNAISELYIEWLDLYHKQNSLADGG